ncbi:MAG: YihY/virulence factor BrkB family protein [Desertifilum sp.]|nr:YihY/virulence factor BrkB family protein [Desertifilum sp.]
MNASVIMPILSDGSGSSAFIRLHNFQFKAIALSISSPRSMLSLGGFGKVKPNLHLSKPLMMNLRDLWRLLKETVAELQFNQISLLASSLAYYTVLSLPPLIVVMIMLVGAIFGEAAAQGEVVNQIQDIVGEEGAGAVQTAIANMREDTGGGTLRLIVNLGFLAFGASGVFAQIQNALDRIWEVKPEPRRHLFHFLRKRLLSFAMVLVIAFLLFVSLVINTGLGAMVQYLSEFLPDLVPVWQILSFLLTLIGATLLFAAMYTILPDAKVEWRDAMVGATITAILFMLGQFFFSIFLNQTDFASAYGVAGSIVILLVWTFYTAHILFLGAEFTKVYARMHGSPIVPEEYAVSRESEAQTSERRNK